MTRTKKPPTESQKISVHIMDMVRHYKNKTDIPLTKIIDRAVLEHLSAEKVNCECGDSVLLIDARMDSEGCWYCPMCIKEMKK